MDVITNLLLRRAVPLFGVLAAVLLVLALGAILHLGQEVLVPLALATLLSFALAPIVRWLRRRRLGNGPAVLSAVLSALALIVFLGWVVYTQVAGLTAEIPAHEAAIRKKVQLLSAALHGPGAFSEAAAVVTRLVEDLDSAPSRAAEPGQTTPVQIAPPAQVIALPPPESGLGALLGYLTPFLHPLAILFVVLLLSAFMLSERTELRNRLIRLAGVDDIQQTSAALDDAGRRVGRVLLTQLAVNAAFGLVIGLGLWAIGTPSPFLWGIFAGLLRFVPYVGALIGVMPPLVVAFAFDPGWGSLAWTLALFAVVEPITGHGIEPLLYGHSTGLSPLAILVSATLWTFLWGPIGLVLATPLTVCLVVIGRHIERLEFLHVLLSNEPALSLHESFYQRLLSGDAEEVGEQAREFLKTREIATYYDEVALAALRRAHLDIVRGDIHGERLQTLVDATATLIALLARQDASGRVATATSKASRGLDTSMVAILHGENPLDPAAAAMLEQALTARGTRVAVRSLRQLADTPEVATDDVRMVCFSFIEPLSVLHLRAYSRKARNCAPGAEVTVCVWQEGNAGFAEQLQSRLRVAGVFTSVGGAAGAIQSALRKGPAGRAEVPRGRSRSWPG